ncbi:patatin-like phospholipase family protein [Arcticibacterium luteifluviistationis]|uniref:Patatin n=1 Tax=Arcticibacterium luteifluviistationis TaxID=1784714 RepID=A0A2Z4GD94_9BACT|nr:patatin-like phospholipase family protein [Arcticibacterium luteifluviistationis]AWV98995.1 patatin [Arcticibacterium luteifluviistationis]
MRALVLGGGSLKGAWQVGAIQAVLETGFKPEMIYGISAGALNAGFMVNEAGRQHIDTGAIDWDVVNKKLIQFWIENITKPDDIGLLKSRFQLGIDTLLSRFDGLLDTNPLHEKLRKYINLTTLRRSPIDLKVGAVNVNTGKMHYADPMEQHFLDYLRASSSIPIMMPAIQIGGDHRQAYLDGGLREVVPLKKAIEDGATEIYAIATHPKTRELEPINYRSFFSMIERIKDISVNQFENNDIEWAENYNENLVSIAGFTLNKKVSLKVIRPIEPININLTSFDSDDIKEVIKQGYQFAYTELR